MSVWPTLLHAQCPDLERQVHIKSGLHSARSILTQIERSSEIRFSYNLQDLKGVSFNISETKSTINSVLNYTLAQRGFEFECISENSVLVYKKVRDPEIDLTGFVIDSENLGPVADAVVYSRKKGWTICDADGFFQIRDLPVPDTLLIVMPGFVTAFFPISGKNEQVEIRLHSDSALKEVLISGRDSLLLGNFKGGWMVNTGRLSSFPTFSVTPGVLNNLALLPGLQSAFEVNGGIVVRGGDLNQNLVLMDGLEIYNPTHSFGMFGVFSGNSLQSVELYKGNFPSRFSGRASSVMQMRSKQGDLRKWNGVATFNPLFTSIDVNGPLKKERTGMNLSMRRSLTDLFPLYFEQIQEQNEIDRFRFYFFDLKLNVDHKLKSNGKLYFSSYLGGDVGYINSKQEENRSLIEREENRDNFNQGNLLLQAGWKRWWKWHIASNISAGVTQYRFDLRNRYDLSFKSDTLDYTRATQFKYRTQIRDYQIRADLSRKDRFNGIWNAGSQFILHDFIPNRSFYSVTENGRIAQEAERNNGQGNAQELRNYIEYNGKWRNLEANMGVTGSYFKNDRAYRLLQPRVNATYSIKPALSIHAGYGKTSQFLHAIPNNNTGLPFNVWVPADSEIPPVTTEQFETGLRWDISEKYALSVDAYTRSMNNVLAYRFNILDLISAWHETVISGSGRSKGLEFLALKSQGNLTGWIKYSLSRTDRSFAEFNDGNWFPFQFDRRHDLAVVARQRISRNWQLGLSTVYTSGHYITIPETQYLIYLEGEPRLISQFGRMNNLQVPDYFRMDAGITYSRNSGKFRHVFSMNVYNLTNRINVYYVTATIQDDGVTRIEPVSLLPILPSLSYALHF
ncbi:MAG: TonB-dependent receptor [Flavobacteriales bacterium]|nr:TonB-dependent receptor [Flavobacteriales bacterium]